MRMVALALFFLTAFLSLGAQDVARVHIVKPGDTLPKLVWIYGVSADRICLENGLSSDALQPGMRLVIPDNVSGRTVPMAPAKPLPVARAQAGSPPQRAALPVSDPLPPVAERRPAPAPVSTPKSAESPVAPGGGNAFLDAIQLPASCGIRYNGRWTPPGENAAWVMDCSNTARWLHQYVSGIEIPRTASDQYEWLRQRRRLWKARPDAKSLRKKLQPGDLLFWQDTCKPVRKPPITHVMLYLGTDESGRMKMAGSQGSSGPDIYVFDPALRMGGYRFFLFFKKKGKFVAYGRP